MTPLSKTRTLIEILVVLAVMLGVKDMADRFEMIGAGGFAMWTGIGLATLLMRQHGLSWKEFGLTLPQGWKNYFKAFGLALATVVVIFLFFAFLMPVLADALGAEKAPDAADRFKFLLGHPWKLFAYLVVVIWIGAAMGEEILMRGFLLNYLSNIFGTDKKGWIFATIMHAVFFGSLHIYQGMHGVIATGVVAIIFATVYLKTNRKLFPLIIAHGIVNSIALIAYYLSDGVVT